MTALPDSLSSLHSEGIVVNALVDDEWEQILSPAALRFIATLEREHRWRRLELLVRRAERQLDLDGGITLDFLPQTKSIRDGDWRVAPIPADLRDRRVEITGPTDRKMIINALNSGANVFMADFEDSTSPTWDNLIQGQLNLRDAIDGTIEHRSEEGKLYRLGDRLATLFVRPRGWHLVEAHLLVDGEPASASIFDFALYFFHNASALLAKGSGPYFYLPKMESHLEARLWNDIFIRAQELLSIPQGTIRATVLIETLPAAFEMDEILHELREHSAGLNCGRWDYIFSCIKKLRRRPGFVLPDRAALTMNVPFLKSYSELLIKTCHRRGIHAMGGMAAQIPIKSDPEANRLAMDKVSADKRREVAAGHDGTWVAHPGLVSLAKAIFDEGMPGPNQIERKRDDVHVNASDLLAAPEGVVTEAGVRTNVRVAILYLEAWLRGLGCVPIANLMEDAATAEISRTQLWQWLHHSATLADGRLIDADLYREIRRSELESIRDDVGEREWRLGWIPVAAEILDKLILDTELQDFLTIPAYEELLRIENKRRN
ncbi:MAG TPA: malate synthase A [Thermoanaerobaculia bacterium]|nr:malate synthase A [Thermoanaerobaculia bacterium]